MKKLTVALLGAFALFSYGNTAAGNEANEPAFRNTSTEIYTPQSNGDFKTPSNAKKAEALTFKYTSATSDGVITETPAGEMKTFTRSGKCYGTKDNATWIESTQAGTLKMVTAEDGKTVYLKELVFGSVGMGGWVTGEINGTTITVPTGQKLGYLSQNGAYLTMHVLNYDKAQSKFVIDEAAKNVTLTVDGNNITLNGTNKDRILGLVYSNDNTWTLFGDFESTYTLFEDKVAEAPAGLQTENYKVTANNSFGNPVTFSIEMGFDGSEVYISGLCNSIKDGWVKGTKDDSGNITLPRIQFAGLQRDFYPIYFISCNISGSEATFADMELTYNKATESYTTSQWYFESRSKTDIEYVESYSNITISKLGDIEFTTDMITEQPEGELKVYSRNGFSFVTSSSGVFETDQKSYLLKVVHAPDGKTVYIKDPVSQFNSNAWVKGTIEGNKITTPLFQCVDFDERYQYGTLTAKLVFDEAKKTFVLDEITREVTYTINPADNSITLDGFAKEDNSVYGLIYSDTFEWAGYGDFETHYTLFTKEMQTIPAGLTTEKWALTYFRKWDKQYDYVNVAFDGDIVYISGLPEVAEEAAIVGTIKGGKVIFNSDQYIGSLAKYDVEAYFGSATYVKEEAPTNWVYTITPSIEMTFNREMKSFIPAEKNAIIINGGKPSEQLKTVLACLDPKFDCYEEHAATPQAPAFTEYNDYTEKYGYITFVLDIPTFDVDGHFIAPEKLAYQIFTMKDGVETPYVFKKSSHTGLKEDMEIIPFEFGDNYDIYPGGTRVYIYVKDVDNVAVQSINYSAGEEKRSAKVWYNDLGGVDEIAKENKEVSEITYYNVNGIRIAKPEKGIFIKSTKYTDGSVDNEKVIITD